MTLIDWLLMLCLFANAYMLGINVKRHSMNMYINLIGIGVCAIALLT